ncbi:universal stress protein [Haloferax larsenii]|uniref:Universal stress protein family protein n=1 Tax=Haloferax larsenii TaxID=302484 RepID=A0A1H7PGD2_HALLR|nr:universal stress protein [Haloferax larsenii]SEL34686.1 Universal stress protein family protein [Haloferax larsenii]
MEHSNTDGPVLVAVEDPAHVQQLVRTAGDLARVRSGAVRLVTVLVKPYDSPFGVFDDETILRNFSGDSRELLAKAKPPEGVVVERDVVVARSVAGGVLKAVGETAPSALVVGWLGLSRRSDAVFGTTVDKLIEKAPCDVYVERIGQEANGVDSILVPVAGGPHVEAAAAVASAIADRNDARILVYSVATPSFGTEGAREFVEAGSDTVKMTPPFGGPIETKTETADDATTAIIEESAAHDIVVLGATRKGSLRRRLVGSVAKQVVARTDTTVILARDADVVRTPLQRLGELLRR